MTTAADRRATISGIWGCIADYLAEMAEAQDRDAAKSELAADEARVGEDRRSKPVILADDARWCNRRQQ